MNVQTQQLESAVIAEVQRIRQFFADHDISNFTFKINASGRTEAGDAKIEYTIGGQYGESSVSGSLIEPAISEYLRRKGWDARYMPLALPAPTETRVEEPVALGEKPDDEIPF